VLDLLGNSTMLDSVRMARRGGDVCVARGLGGGTPAQVDILAAPPGAYCAVRQRDVRRAGVLSG